MPTKEKGSGLLHLQCPMFSSHLYTASREAQGTLRFFPQASWRRDAARPLRCRSSHPTEYLGTGSWGMGTDQGPPTGCKARSGAVRTAKVLPVKVRGVCGVRAQGRCVNSRVNRVCAHGGRASWRQAMRSAWSGWAQGRAPGVLCAPRWCASEARGCRRTECEGPRVSGARKGTASVCLSDYTQSTCACRAL